jgi:outer membrane protein assembly factor BamB
MIFMGKKLLSITLALAFVFSVCTFNVSSAQKCSWLCYGGNVAGTNSASADCGPIGDKLEIAWQAQLSAPILSQPAVDGKNLFFGTFKNVFYCIDSETGKISWEQSIGGSVYSTPCIDSTNVYICSWDRKAYCFGKNDGTRKWAFGTELYIFNSPIIVNDWLFIGSRDEKLYCLNPQTGSKKWELRVGPVTSTPIYALNKVYVAEHEGSIFCIDPIKQTVVWEVKTGGIIESSVAYDSEKIYVGTTKENEAVLLCLDAKTGKELWRYKTDYGLWSDPCIGDGMVYVSVENNLFALSQNTGSVKWTDTIESGRYSQVLHCGDKIYYGTSKNGFFARSSQTGDLVYELPLKTPVRVPCIASNKVFFGCEDGSIYCLSGEIEKLESISISPDSVTVPINGTAKFTANGTLNTGEKLENVKVAWSVSDEKIGTIDQDGLFKAIKPGSVKVYAELQNLKAEAKVNVEHFIRVTPNPVVMENVPYGSKATIDLNIENLIKLNLNYTATSDKPETVKADPVSGTIWTDGLKITLTIDTKGMQPGSVNNFVLRIDYEKTWMEIPIKVTISSNSVQCVKFEPYMLDFGYISRGSTKSLEFKIHYTGVPVKGKLKPLQPWIEISPTEFTSDDPNQIFTVSITASALPTGDSFGGSIKLEMDEPMCQQTSLNIIIKTDKGIVLRLEIENREAYINNQKVKLDVPAKLIGGRTMVPIRFISESFGCRVNWDPKTKEITINRHQMTFKLWLGVNYAMVNDVKQPLDSPPVIVDGRTLVPLRFISEPFGAKVEWDSKTKKITVVWDPN